MQKRSQFPQMEIGSTRFIKSEIYINYSHSIVEGGLELMS